MNLSKRLITLTAALAIGLTASVTIASTAFAGGGTGGNDCGVRRTTGDGGTKRFCRGERVAGEVISLRKADGTWGRTFYRCFLPDPGRRGRVTSGVIRYFPAEVRRLPNCHDTLSSAGPRDPTGSGNWGHFDVNDHVLGFVIETGGKTYFKCGMRKVDHDGRALDGVVNPSRFELGAIKRCSDTDNVRPGYRTESGDGSLRFQRGDYIVAAFIKLDDGQDTDGDGNGCHMIAPQEGTLYGGVRNYWPGEQGNLPHC